MTNDVLESMWKEVAVVWLLWWTGRTTKILRIANVGQFRPGTCLTQRQSTSHLVRHDLWMTSNMSTRNCELCPNKLSLTLCPWISFVRLCYCFRIAVQSYCYSKCKHCKRNGVKSFLISSEQWQTWRWLWRGWVIRLIDTIRNRVEV